eukprot:TRINITY_DN15428_c0_g1_i1.p2 TRINITY_DN15428_c0_g1~~TRINITY_DN15428_c0_g1_i1.p2  ORF type:complete len:136 (+),score=28.70 TRINITY_DN15428_c0_g1_i1:146-553(+)
MTFNGMNLEDDAHFTRDFKSSTNLFTLSFKEERLERKYRAGKFNPLSTLLSLKLALAALVIIMLVRKIMVSVLAFQGRTSQTKAYSIFDFTFLMSTIVIEAMGTLCKRLKFIRGFMAMSYVAMNVSRSSFRIAPM